MKPIEDIKLCSVNNSLEAERIMMILKDNEIASFSKSGIMKVYGVNSAENDIYISSDDYQKALDVMREYNLEEKKVYDCSSKKAARSMLPRAFGIILLIVIVAVILVPIIFLFLPR